jgi:hypothetical protein
MLLTIPSISRYASCPMPNSRIVAVGKSGRGRDHQSGYRSTVQLDGCLCNSWSDVRLRPPHSHAESVKAVAGLLKAVLLPSN